MKKLISIILALTMLLGIAGCSDLGISEEDVINAVIDVVSDSLEDSESNSESIIEDSSGKTEKEENKPLYEKEEEETESKTDIKIEIEAEESIGGPILPGDGPESEEPAYILDEYGDYYSKEDVALYIHTYNKLPVNFITKNEARDLGWEGGSVEEYGEGLAIGGDKFGNREGLLPKKSGRQYYECDIDTLGKDSRGAKRIVFSNDGLIYYTDDHYETFTLLYGEP